MKKRYLSLLLGAGLVAGYIVGYAGTTDRDDPSITPGVVFSGIVAEQVSMLSFSSAGTIITAQRSMRGGEFLVQATFADGRPAQRCTATPDLSGQLASLSSFVAKRQLSFEERGNRFPVHVGNLILQPDGQEPGNTMMVFSDEARASIAFVFDRYAAELTLPVAAFERLETGCAAF